MVLKSKRINVININLLNIEKNSKLKFMWNQSNIKKNNNFI